MFNIFPIIVYVFIVVGFLSTFTFLLVFSKIISKHKTFKDAKNEKAVIDESQEKLKDYSDTPSQKKKTIKCEYCGSKIDKDATSCSNCGKKL